MTREGLEDRPRLIRAHGFDRLRVDAARIGEGGGISTHQPLPDRVVERCAQHCSGVVGRGRGQAGADHLCCEAVDIPGREAGEPHLPQAGNHVPLDEASVAESGGELEVGLDLSEPRVQVSLEREPAARKLDPFWSAAMASASLASASALDCRRRTAAVAPRTCGIVAGEAPSQSAGRWATAARRWRIRARLCPGLTLDSTPRR